MNVEDCKVGMKVKCTTDNPKGMSKFLSTISKGDILTISELREDLHYDTGIVINFEEIDCIWWAKDFEPANKFEVGDKVRFNKGKGFNAKIFAIADKEDGFGDKYCITYKSQGHLVHAITKKEHLSPLKKKDELEKGDKFKDYSGNTVEVLARENNPVNTTYYFGRTNSENIDVWTHNDVREIIYD